MKFFVDDIISYFTTFNHNHITSSGILNDRSCLHPSNAFLLIATTLYRISIVFKFLHIFCYIWKLYNYGIYKISFCFVNNYVSKMTWHFICQAIFVLFYNYVLSFFANHKVANWDCAHTNYWNTWKHYCNNI